MIQTRHVTAKVIKSEPDSRHVSTKGVDVSPPKPEGDINEIVQAKTTTSVNTGNVEELNKRANEAASQVKEKGIIDAAIAANKKKAAAKAKADKKKADAKVKADKAKAKKDKAKK